MKQAHVDLRLHTKQSPLALFISVLTKHDDCNLVSTTVGPEEALLLTLKLKLVGTEAYGSSSPLPLLGSTLPPPTFNC